MFQNVRLSGAGRAVIVWGYHTAATLGAWEVSVQGVSGRLTASVETADRFKLTQPDVKLRILRQKGQMWEWPLESLHFADRTVTATVRVADQE